MTNMTNIVVTPIWNDVSVDDVLVGRPSLLDWTAMTLQVSGSQDWNLVHHNRDFAHEGGHDDVFFNTGWTSAMLCGVLTDWAGHHGWLLKIDFRMTKMNSLGDTVTAKAKVRAKTIDEGAAVGAIEFDVWLESDRQGVTTEGTAIVTLPL